MITLLTGAPGTGKTAQLVEWLRSDKHLQGRSIFVHGLNGLKLPHNVIDASKWHKDLPDGAVLVVDEVQQVWRPRGPGHAAPDSVQALETHRHRGVDVFLTTQRPNLLDSNVRGLVGRHVHIRDTGWLGRRMYEWPEVSDNLSWKTCPLKRKYVLPKKAFELYTSAVEHTTVQKGRSWMPLITIALLLLSVLLVVMVVRAIKAHTEPTVLGLAAAASSPRGAPFDARPLVGGEITASALVASFTPRVSAMPNSAPAYDELRRVLVMPRIVGGYCVGQVCKCMNNQNLDAGLSQDACRQWLKAPPFDPYYIRPEPTITPVKAYSGQQAAPTTGARAPVPSESRPQPSVVNGTPAGGTSPV